MLLSLGYVQHAADKKSLPASFVIILALRHTSIEPNVVKMRMPSSKTVLYMVKRG